MCDIVFATGERLNLLEEGHDLPREGDHVILTRLHFLGGNRPEAINEIDLGPFRATELAWS